MTDDWTKAVSKFQEQMGALEQNIQAHNRGAQQIHAWELSSILDDIGSRWRVAWEMMPRDQIFDSLYAFRPDDSYRPFLFRQDPADADTHAVIAYDEDEKWYPHLGPQAIIDWLIDNPPFSEVEPVAELYQYAKGLELQNSPWVLWMALIGQRPIIVKDTILVADMHLGGIDMFNLIPLGENGTLPFAKAMTAYALSPEVSQSYIHLIDAYDSYLTTQ